tara:strand:- start:90 stop:497 length:408 start_codon:yes stop_codon:yes gene_type:complete
MQISDEAMVPIKDTREALYKMLAAQFVYLQEVPKGADRIPSRTFYLWSVDLKVLVRKLIDDLRLIMRNLLLRGRTERQGVALQLEASRGGEQDISQEDRDALRQYRQREAKLENSLNYLDYMCMSLQQFSTQQLS